MRVDPTFPSRTSDNFQSIRKDLGKLGTKAGIAQVFTATATLDFPSISAGSSQELTVTVTGAKTGDAVYLGPPSGLESNLSAIGYVSAADTVTVRAINPTSGSINPASATWRVLVIGF